VGGVEENWGAGLTTSAPGGGGWGGWGGGGVGGGCGGGVGGGGVRALSGFGTVNNSERKNLQKVMGGGAKMRLLVRLPGKKRRLMTAVSFRFRPGLTKKSTENPFRRRGH